MPKKENTFAQDVYAICREIPTGRVTSYGAIAKALGLSRSARMVGYAMNNSFTVKPSVPAHRVVNRNGVLTGKHHFGGPDTMQVLLEQEGIVVKDDQIQDFSNIFWDPAVELGNL